MAKKSIEKLKETRENLKLSINNEATYSKGLKLLQVDKQIQELEHIEKLKELKEKHQIPPKSRVKYTELVIMISYVLETGKNGTKAIRYYAESTGKTQNWIDDVSKSKQQVHKKTLQRVLDEYKNHPDIVAAKENGVYDENDILKNTLTGALKKLSKQIKLSNQINELKKEIATLKSNLADKQAGKDWQPKALELKQQKLSIRKISEQLGVPKSTVNDFLRSQKIQ